MAAGMAAYLVVGVVGSVAVGPAVAVEGPALRRVGRGPPPCERLLPFCVEDGGSRSGEGASEKKSEYE